ncbi:hypothetical protein [Spirosoma sordidisoli]|uniref:Uncharacterized protein n=1 Tax=Spirosoma sordidisoli TaxID=2502893 RepID=A0A4Q2UNH0_9BACT|nr:hypothetical protein [Spirosoma sordidisoli]RYC70876.1 hypothetical protein EQG79_01610 [Spirosoma sordidisoli]
MSTKSNQPNLPESQETQTPTTPPATQPEVQTQEVKQPEVKTEPSTPEPAPQIDIADLIDIKAFIAEGIKNGVAAALAAQKVQEAAAQAATPPAEEPESKPTGKNTWPYGNKDKNKEFDLSTMTGLSELPTDKVVAVLPKYNTDSEGKQIGYDKKNCIVQFFDPGDYDARSKTDKQTGSSTFQMLGLEPVVVHRV